MKIFGPLYERAMKWAAHERAPTYLTVLSFFEAIIFPVMPEVMLAPMCVAQPKRGWWFATLSLAGSMLGALVGYALGHYAFEAIKPLFEALGMLPAIEQGITTVQAKMAESPGRCSPSGAGRIHAHPDEGLHVGIGYRRRTHAAVPAEHADRSRQARVRAGRGHPYRWCACRSRTASLD